MLKLYGNVISTCTQQVANICHEKKVPFEVISIDFSKGEHKSPNFLTKQPFGQVPYIDDDGFILYESRAICRYLEAKYPNQGTSLVPTGLQANALFEQAASIEVTNFDKHVVGAVFEKIYKPMFGQEPDLEAFNKLISTLDRNLAIYDKILGQQKYLSGEVVSLADLFHLPSGVLLKKTGCDVLSKYPNVDRWFTDLESRASWQAVKDVVKSIDSY